MNACKEQQWKGVKQVVTVDKECFDKEFVVEIIRRDGEVEELEKENVARDGGANPRDDEGAGSGSGTRAKSEVGAEIDTRPAAKS
jgi:hypothetical protein